MEGCLASNFHYNKIMESLVKQRQKRGNQILFRKEDRLFHSLYLALAKVDEKTIILWALQLAKEAITNLEQDGFPSVLLNDMWEKTWAWAQGSLKMPEAKAAILAVHALAKETPRKEQALLCHAIAQAGSCVHTTGHAMGFPLYELSAIIFAKGCEKGIPQVMQRIVYYEKLLLQIEKAKQKDVMVWASFIEKRGRKKANVNE